MKRKDSRQPYLFLRKRWATRRDHDALARLRSARAFNAKMNLALLSPDAEKILSELPMDAARMRHLNFIFGDGQPTNDYLVAIRALAGEFFRTPSN
jgi:hypothetical protein